jgi:hypothetical protein
MKVPARTTGSGSHRLAATRGTGEVIDEVLMPENLPGPGPSVDYL